MSDAAAFGFGKFIPGFDFLQNLGKAGQGPQGMPALAHWVAPTVSVEEIEKRIEELKAVQFWLEQNSRALTATVQALEVQKMTLSALQGMNVNLGDLGKAFPFAAAAATVATAAVGEGAPGPLSDWPLSGAAAAQATAPAAPSPEPAAPPASKAPAQPAAEAPTDAAPNAAQAASMAQAMQWWGALTQQFQHIAQQTLQDPAQQQALLKATQMGSEFAQKAVKTANDMVRQAAAPTPPAPTKATAAAGGKPAATAKAAAQRQAATKPAAPRRAAAKPSVPATPKKPVAATKGKATAAKKQGTPAKRSTR